MASCSVSFSYTINADYTAIEVGSCVVCSSPNGAEVEEKYLIQKLHSQNCTGRCPHELPKECLEQRSNINIMSCVAIIAKKRKNEEPKNSSLRGSSNSIKKAKKNINPYSMSCNICGALGKWCLDIIHTVEPKDVVKPIATYPYTEILCCDECDDTVGQSIVTLNKWLKSPEVCDHGPYWYNLIGKIKAQCTGCGIISVANYCCPTCQRTLGVDNPCDCDRCPICLCIREDGFCNVCNKECPCSDGVRRCKCARCESCFNVDCSCLEESQPNGYFGDSQAEENNEEGEEEGEEGEDEDEEGEEIIDEERSENEEEE